MRQKRKKSKGMRVFLAAIVLIIAGAGWLFNEHYLESQTQTENPGITALPTTEVAANPTNQPTTKPTSEQTSNPTSDPVSGQENPELTVHFIDVGQADSILIESEGNYMLIDGGNNDDKECITEYLNNLGVTRLEYVIGTHPHEDHIGSLDTVIDTYEIGKVYAPYVEHTSKTYYDFLMSAVNKQMQLRQPEAGTQIMLGRCEVTFLSPNKDYKDDLNNWSMGVKITNGVHTFVMCGDAEMEAENDIVANGIDLKADVLKLGHHGSSTSSSDVFIDKVAPEYAVISCGTDNSYGHPHKETMDKLKRLGIAFFRTDDQGTIVAHSDGKVLTWNVKPSENYKSGNE